ncbi:MAG: hypothetical protein ACTSR8_18230 [Promethearchaeota archaeon]
MIGPANNNEYMLKIKQELPVNTFNFWKSSVYSPLLNKQSLNKTLKRNIWKCEISSMLNGFIEDIDDYKRDLKFKVSGKILNSSTYVLKTKTHKIIDSSLETQEDIQETQQQDILQEEEVGDEDFIDYEESEDNNYRDYDDEEELFAAFSELEAQNLLSQEQKKAFKEEKIDYFLNLDIKELYNTLQQKTCILKTPPKILYKRIQLKDLSTALTDVLKNKENIKAIRKGTKKQPINKNKLPFLPEKLIVNAEKKRADFENRITQFYENLKAKYQDVPIPFLKMISEPSVNALVEAVLCVLHLVNHKKLELWCSYKEGEIFEQNGLENSGQNIYITPL